MGRQRKGSLHPFAFSKGTDGSYLLEEIDASLANLDREGKKAFSEKVYQGLELGKKIDLKALLATIRAYNPSSDARSGLNRKVFNYPIRMRREKLIYWSWNM